MAAGRLNRPAIFLYGGSSLPGQYKGKDISIVYVFEGIGSVGRGLMTEEELYEIECNACPGQGSCAGMFTANTMASVGEAIGMSMPGTASLPAEDPKLRKASEDSGKALINLLKKDIKPRDIMTRGAFLNAITTVLALGGSTNAVLHLMAIAYESEVELSLNDFDNLQLLIWENLFAFHILLRKFLYPLTLSSESFTSLPGAAIEIKVNLKESAPYLFINSRGSITLPFDLDIF